MNKVQKTIRYLSNRRVPISIEPTNICSARCSFCWYGKGGDWRKPGYISDEVIDNVLGLLGQHCKKDVVTLVTAHGDVTCYPELPTLIERITSLPNVSGGKFFTNAILLHKYTDELLNLPIKSIAISTALGSEEQFRRLYGRDLYKQTLHNIVEFLRRNKGRIPVAIHLRVDKPFDMIKETTDYKIIEDLVGEKQMLFLEEWDDFNGLIKKSDLPRGDHHFRLARANPEIPCYALYRKLHILKDGEIIICNCRLSPDLIVGDVFDARTLDEVWHGESLKKLRQDWVKGELPEICHNCSHYHPVTNLYRSTFERTKKRVRNMVRNILLPNVVSLCP